MATIGRYCKAYPITQLRAFGGWQERPENARREILELEGKEIEQVRELTEDTYLFLHENHVVTDGIYLDENVIFDHVTDEWKRFCAQELRFKIPDFDAPPAASGQAAS